MKVQSSGLTVKQKVCFKQSWRGRKQMDVAATPESTPIPLGRVPRVARLMALAIRFEGLIADGEVHDYAELARLGHVTRARVTQIMNLLNLAPDIQEAILFLQPVASGRDPIKEWQVRPLAAGMCWETQRRKWHELNPSDV